MLLKELGFYFSFRLRKQFPVLNLLHRNLRFCSAHGSTSQHHVKPLEIPKGASRATLNMILRY